MFFKTLLLQEKKVKLLFMEVKRARIDTKMLACLCLGIVKNMPEVYLTMSTHYFRAMHA